MKNVGIIWSVLLLFFFSCRKDAAIFPLENTRYLVVVIIDGPRYSETFGDSTLQNIPQLNRIRQEGVLYTNFRNTGVTATTSGHTSLLTGVDQVIDNSGNELPDQVSFLQVYGKTYNDAKNVWLITSKDKLEVLANCKDPNWNNTYLPNTNCGVSGRFSGYREDSTTFRIASEILRDKHPHVCFIQFKQPDAAGHSGVWQDYILGIKKSDEYTGLLYDQVMNDPFYKGKTAFIITSDHGRHLDPPYGAGFQNHGDNCEGCRRISLIACGADFRRNVIDTLAYSQRDFAVTVAHIFGLKMPAANGNVMHSMFK